MMSVTFGLFTQVSGSGPLGPLVLSTVTCFHIILVGMRDGKVGANKKNN